MNKELIKEQKSKRPGKVWIISDTHHFHAKIVEFSNRPVDFSERIIKNWNSVVMPQDTVINLGDVSWGGKDKLLSVTNQLVGTKVLVRGNHDKSRSDNWFRDAGFSFVCQKTMIKNVMLSHMPTRLNEDEIKRGVINIHGHFHNMRFEIWEDFLKERLSDNHYLLSLEHTNYRPVLLLDAVEKGDVIKSLDLKNKGIMEF